MFLYICEEDIYQMASAFLCYSVCVCVCVCAL